MRDFVTLALMVACCFAIAATIILAYTTGAIFDDARDRAVHEAEVRQRTQRTATAHRDTPTAPVTQSPPG